MTVQETLFKRTLRELVTSVHSIGAKRTFQVILSRLADYTFDLRFGTDTVQPVEVDRLDVGTANKEKAQRYQPTGILPFGKLMRLLALPPGSVLVDFGSGKGRVLLMASRYPFQRVVGVDFSPELCTVARANAEKFRRRRNFCANIEIVQCDAREYAFKDDENVFYFFHPFDEDILKSVLDNAVSSLKRSPRRAWLVYYLPVHKDIVERHGEVFMKEGEYILGGYECLVCTTRMWKNGARIQGLNRKGPGGLNRT